jgi:hypothetical protein
MFFIKAAVHSAPTEKVDETASDFFLSIICHVTFFTLYIMLICNLSKYVRVSELKCFARFVKR